MNESTLVSLAKVVESLGLSVAACGEDLEKAVTGAQVCDLLSHVMAHGKSGQVWITIQTHPNIVAVGALARLAGIILADGLEPGEDTIMRAEEEGLPLLTSSATAYTLAGQLYNLGVR